MTERDILAGEYALGTLDERGRARAKRLMASDSEFARAVAAWDKRLSPLSEAERPVEAPASTWAKIEVALRTPATARGSSLADLAGQLVELKRSLAIWRYATVSAVAAAVALAVVWVGDLESPFRPTAPSERYVAMLQSNTGETGFVVTVDMNGMQFAIRPIVVKTPASKSYELWCILKGRDEPPMTAGIVGTDAYAMMDVPSQITREDLEKGVELAISLEPEGGAPNGKSMGPIMFAGLLMKQTP